MVDENGTNYCTIKEVSGIDFMTFKVVICQMHYKKTVSKASLRIRVGFRDEFKNRCNMICKVATVPQYNEQKKQLDETANLFLEIEGQMC